MQDPKVFQVRISKGLALSFTRDTGSRFPVRLQVDKDHLSLDREEFDWLLSSLYFAKRRNRKEKYRYKWITHVPQIEHVSAEQRHMLGVLERFFSSGRDLDLTQT